MTLGAISWAKTFSEVAIMALKGDKYLTCSSDGVAILDISDFQDWAAGGLGFMEANGSYLVLASVKIKKKVAASTLGSELQLSSQFLVRWEVGDEHFKIFVPLESREQVLYHLF